MAPIDVLLNLVPQHPDRVLAHLAEHPDLAGLADSTGYSLMHAAASYGQLALLRALSQTYRVSADLTDGDGETALFVAEEVAVARCLVEELGASLGWRNDAGQTARERVEEEGEFPELAAWLRGREGGEPATTDGAGSTEGAGGEMLNRPPPLPEGMKINMSVEAPGEEGEAPDPEFRRRIEELAAREDFQSEEGQAELRRLVTEAVTGIAGDQERDVKRRLE